MSIEQAVHAAAKQTARDMIVIAVLAFLAGAGFALMLGALA
ncbi:hypothetical protein [Stenotrophomonas sp. PS02297]|nr:hypothetical protein [Stenotrophomonas sp. PS02297]